MRHRGLLCFLPLLAAFPVACGAGVGDPLVDSLGDDTPPNSYESAPDSYENPFSSYEAPPASGDAVPGSPSGGGACVQFCQRLAAEGCLETSASECPAACAELAQMPYCRAEYDALFACGARSPSIVCDGDDITTIAGCDAQLAAVLACAMQYDDDWGGTGGNSGWDNTGGTSGWDNTGGTSSGTGGTGGSTVTSGCEAGCARMTAAGCDMDGSGNCTTDCAEMRSYGCVTELDAFMGCVATDNTLVCTDGALEETACINELVAYSSCLGY